MTGLGVCNIEKSFGSLKILDGVSFEANKGEIVSIFGPSGCGKTTLLRIIAGLITPENGKILLKSENIGMVFQEPRLLHWRTVRENISLGLELKCMSFGKEKIDSLINLVELDGFGDYYPHKLSGGMKQRVAIARALATDPDVLLMDEPLNSLDQNTRKKLQNTILKICDEKKIIAVFVTHNIEEAEKMGDRIIVLSQKPSTILGIAKSKNEVEKILAAGDL